MRIEGSDQNISIGAQPQWLPLISRPSVATLVRAHAKRGLRATFRSHTLTRAENAVRFAAFERPACAGLGIDDFAVGYTISERDDDPQPFRSRGLEEDLPLHRSCAWIFQTEARQLHILPQIH